MEIFIDGEYSENHRSGSLEITLIATEAISYTNLRLRTALTESNIYWHAPNGAYWHHQTFRDMLPNTSGTGFTISNGDTLTFNQNFSLSSIIQEQNCHAIVFVQSDNGHRILQAARQDISALPRTYELETFNLLTPPAGDTLRTCFPYFEWESSSDPDSGYPVSYEVEIDLSPIFPSPLLSGTVADTSWLDSLYCLINDTTFYWRVRAFNGHAPDLYSNNILYFRIFELGAIVGTVSDSAGTLEGVAVDISGLGLSDTTDGQGEYSFFDLNPGTYDVAFSLDGYRDTSVTGLEVNPGDTVNVDMMMTVYRCGYVPGDANGSGDANGLDVIYLVSYLKGGAPPPESCDCDPHGLLFPGADANGSCSVNGLDVTYLVAYFKGTGLIQYCVDCPPSQ